METVLKRLTFEFFGQGKHKITPEKFFESDKGLLLDVRSKEEAGSISIETACHSNVTCMNIPISEIPDRIHEIGKNQLIAVFCPAQIRASIVYGYLLSQGFSEVRILEGGYAALTDHFKPGKILKAIQQKTEAEK